MSIETMYEEIERANFKYTYSTDWQQWVIPFQEEEKEDTDDNDAS